MAFEKTLETAWVAMQEMENEYPWSPETQDGMEGLGRKTWLRGVRLPLEVKVLRERVKEWEPPVK